MIPGSLTLDVVVVDQNPEASPLERRDELRRWEGGSFVLFSWDLHPLDEWVSSANLERVRDQFRRTGTQFALSRFYFIRLSAMRLFTDIGVG